MVHRSHTKNDIPMHLGQVSKRQKILVSNIFYHFLFAVSFGNWAPKMSEKFRQDQFRQDRKISFQNTLYTKCINDIIDSIGPSIILRSIVYRLVMESITKVKIGVEERSISCKPNI